MRRPVTNRPVKKRLTKADRAERDAFAASEERTRKQLRAQTARAIVLRSKDREFHGLEREFINYQEDILRLFERAKDAKHPRDIGATREQLLRDFLTGTELLPKRYALSTTSIRACSTTGHISNELDLLLYDPLDSVTLMRRGGTYSVLPVESTYGTIQVKSKANRKEIQEGLANIASYKRLIREKNSGVTISVGRPRSKTGFGILFAFDSDLDWMDLISEAKDFAQNNPRNLWCNAIVVLSKGLLLYGSGSQAFIFNGDLTTVQSVEVHGSPDSQGRCLYEFYSILMELLQNTQVQCPPIDRYFRLPLIAGEYSYEYSLGQFAEFGTCTEHGDYARKLTAEKLAQVIQWCKTAQPINWIKANDMASGRPENPDAYSKQPGDVIIYNPDELPLSALILRDSKIMHEGVERTIKAFAFDSIETSGMRIWIPYYYEVRDGIINSCPKCA